VEQSLDILTESLGRIILAVQAETGVDEDEVEGEGLIEPDMNGLGGNGDVGYPVGGYGTAPAWSGSGMSPLRR
jgi:hypothetical protein